MKDILRDYHYHLWANKRIFDHLKGLPEGIERKEVQSVFPTIAAVLAHMHSVDAMWFSVMRGDSFEKTLDLVKKLRRDNKEKSLDELKGMFDDMDVRCTAYFEDQGNLDRLVKVEHPQFGRMETPLSELIRHVVNHGTYHRGNITAMLHQLGHPGVPTDYIIYAFEAGKEER